MVDLAKQFGEAMGNRRALRSALGTAPDPRALEQTMEPHERGAILVAAVFDAFFSVYINRTRDLIRMAYPDGRALVPNFLHADLAIAWQRRARKLQIGSRASVSAHLTTPRRSTSPSGTISAPWSPQIAT